jgi:hypothetical protein
MNITFCRLGMVTHCGLYQLLVAADTKSVAIILLLLLLLLLPLFPEWGGVEKIPQSHLNQLKKQQQSLL